MTRLHEHLEALGKEATAHSVRALEAWQASKDAVQQAREDGVASGIQLAVSHLRKDPPREEGHSVFVQHLCGYDYSPENERERAARMVGLGFVKLQSEKGDDGKRWVVWYLPGAWAAKGEAKGKSLREIVSIVQRRVGPGEIELSTEHWGLAID